MINCQLRPRHLRVFCRLALALIAAAFGTWARAQTAAFTTLQSFSQTSDGLEPVSPLAEGPDGNYYGTAYRGGKSPADSGVVFQVTPAGAQTVFYDFVNDPDMGIGPLAGLLLASDGNFYGTTSQGGSGGATDNGTFFMLTPAGVLTSLYSFDGTNDGSTPEGTLTEGADGNLYGVCNAGGANGLGTIFQITKAGVFTLLHTFAGSDGANPLSALRKGSDNNFYGVTSKGGDANGDGVAFSISSSGTFAVLHTFSGTDGSDPDGALVEVTPGVFLGVTESGGTYGQGTIFGVTSAQAFVSLHQFNLNSDDAGTPFGGLTMAGDGNYYGLTRAGGTNNGGVIFSATAEGGASIAHSFGAPNSQLSYDGVISEAGLVLGSDGKLYGVTQLGGVNNQGSVFTQTTGGVFTLLHSFLTAGGVSPIDRLTRDSSGNFYGTTQFGGAFDHGAIFELTAAGALVTLHNFTGLDGERPQSALLPTSDGSFYGTTLLGGVNGTGSVYKLAADRTLTTLHSFSDTGAGGTNADGAEPGAGGLTASGGNFYGVAGKGGANNADVFFEITPAGIFTNLHNFLATEGEVTKSSLILGSDGKFYGTALYGGSADNGTVFSVTAAGALTLLHTFSALDANGDNSDGAHPFEGFALGPNGLFYGAAQEGGANGSGTIFSVGADGTFSTLYAFSAVNATDFTNLDGQSPGGLTLGSDGNFYGCALAGGAHANGTLFVITPAGALTVLHTFSLADSNGVNADGVTPFAPLIEAANGVFYGTTVDGGSGGVGTIFTITVSPAITSALTASAQAGQAFSYQITATNSPSSFAAASLPPGLTVDAATGLISGTPTGAGSFPAPISASNAGGTGAATLQLTVAPIPVVVPAITSAGTASGQVGVAFSYQIAASNSPASFGASGLPAGLSVDPTAGLVSGTPTAAGTFAVTVSATNSAGTGTAPLTLTIAPAFPVATLVSTIPSVTIGSGGIAQFTLSLSAAQSGIVVVSYAIKGTAVNGVDYTLLTGHKKFKPGKTSKPINIIPQGDLGGASKKTVKLVLEPGDGYTVGTTGKVKVSILAGQ